MKQTTKILAVLMVVLVFTFYSRAKVNISGGLFQTDLNAGGKNLTNVGGVFSPNGSPITGGGGPSAFATNANLPVNPISVSANYLIGSADESAMLTNKVLYMVSGTPTITVSNPPTSPVSFFVEEVGTSPISMATVSGVTFWKANGQTGIYTNAASITNYFSKTVQFTAINSTNWLISDPIPIQELVDRATTAAGNVVSTFRWLSWFMARTTLTTRLANQRFPTLCLVTR